MWRRAWWPYLAVLVVATALDLATALSIRYTAARSPLAVLYAVLLTWLWWATIRFAVARRGYLIPLLGAAVVGTWLGITWF